MCHLHNNLIPEQFQPFHCSFTTLVPVFFKLLLLIPTRIIFNTLAMVVSFCSCALFHHITSKCFLYHDTSNLSSSLSFNNSRFRHPPSPFLVQQLHPWSSVLLQERPVDQHGKSMSPEPCSPASNKSSSLCFKHTRKPLLSQSFLEPSLLLSQEGKILFHDSVPVICFQYGFQCCVFGQMPWAESLPHLNLPQGVAMAQSQLFSGLQKTDTSCVYKSNFSISLHLPQKVAGQTPLGRSTENARKFLPLKTTWDPLSLWPLPYLSASVPSMFRFCISIVLICSFLQHLIFRVPLYLPFS